MKTGCSVSSAFEFILSRDYRDWTNDLFLLSLWTLFYDSTTDHLLNSFIYSLNNSHLVSMITSFSNIDCQMVGNGMLGMKPSIATEIDLDSLVDSGYLSLRRRSLDEGQNRSFERIPTLRSVDGFSRLCWWSSSMKKSNNFQGSICRWRSIIYLALQFLWYKENRVKNYRKNPTNTLRQST